MKHPKNCKKCGGKMQAGGLQPYVQSNTVAGSITPTGQSSLINNSNMTPEQIAALAQQYGFRTDSNKNLQEDLFGYAQKNQPQAYNAVMGKYGQTNSGSFVDGMLGARTTDLLQSLQRPQPPAPQPARASLTEHFFGPDQHALGMASQRYRDSQSVEDAGVVNTAAPQEWVDFQYYKPNSTDIDESRGRYKIPNSVWTNQISRGTNRITDPTLLDQYRMDSPSIASKMRGGILQSGGRIDLSSYNQLIRPEDIIYPEMDTSDLGMSPRVPRFIEGVEKGIVDLPKGYTSAQEYYNFVNSPAERKRNPATPKNWRQNLGLGIMGLTALGSEISGRVARARQNQYDYDQQTALGMMNPMPTTDYQPNPYSLYSKYGGKLKMKKYGGLQHVDYFGPPFSNGATYKFSDAEKYDKTVVSRKLVPQLFLSKFVKKKEGGIHIKPENKGKFTDYCGGKVTDECIQKGLNSPSATIRKRAQFAKNSRSWNK